MLRYTIVILIVFFHSLTILAREDEVVLSSDLNDKVTIRYQTSEDDGNISITFIGTPSKTLSLINKKKYDDLRRVKVVCFDKNGGHKDDFFISKIATEIIGINTDSIKYKCSEDGVIWIEDQSEINLSLVASHATISIPVYLAYYEKKHKYTIFARCGTLDIPLHSVSTHSSPTPKSILKTTTTTQELELEVESFDKKDLAIKLVEKITDLLKQSSESELPDCLSTYEENLRKIELEITDKDIKKNITDALNLIEERKRQVEQYKHDIGELDDSLAEIIHARQDLAYVNDRLNNIDKLTESDIIELKSKGNELRHHSYAIKAPELATDMRSAADRCDNEIKKIEDGKKRHKLMMIVGGIILVILLFVGNQMFQLFQSHRNQKNIENIAYRAEEEAKRRSQRLVRNDINRAQAQIRNRANYEIKEGINKVKNNVKKGGNNKTISI